VDWNHSAERSDQWRGLVNSVPNMCFFFFFNAQNLTSWIATTELHLSGRWLSWSPIIQIGLALRVNLSRILQDSIALKLPVIGSSTLQCYGGQNFKSGVVEEFRRKYILWIVTAKLQTANVAYFQRKIQLSGFSTYLDGSPSQLIRILVSGVLL
jgi:hypothetical protein